MTRGAIRVGTAAWAVPRDIASAFAAEGTSLARYASVLDTCEINTTFWRRHKTATFERWRRAVPASFRFAVKMPRTVTHEAELHGAARLVAEFFDDVSALGKKLGPVLVQLPPSLAFDRRRASSFFRAVRRLHSGAIALEPRHETWLSRDADRLLVDHEIARVVADPPRPAGVAAPGGARSLVYYRLHGSPRRYYSAYGADRVGDIAVELLNAARGRGTRSVFCIFDNTASGAAAADALLMRDAVWRLSRGAKSAFRGAKR